MFFLVNVFMSDVNEVAKVKNKITTTSLLNTDGWVDILPDLAIGGMPGGLIAIGDSLHFCGAVAY